MKNLLLLALILLLAMTQGFAQNPACINLSDTVTQDHVEVELGCNRLKTGLANREIVISDTTVMNKLNSFKMDSAMFVEVFSTSYDGDDIIQKNEMHVANIYVGGVVNRVPWLSLDAPDVSGQPDTIRSPLGTLWLPAGRIDSIEFIHVQKENPTLNMSLGGTAGSHQVAGFELHRVATDSIVWADTVVIRDTITNIVKVDTMIHDTLTQCPAVLTNPDTTVSRGQVVTWSLGTQRILGMISLNAALLDSVQEGDLLFPYIETYGGKDSGQVVMWGWTDHSGIIHMEDTSNMAEACGLSKTFFDMLTATDSIDEIVLIAEEEVQIVTFELQIVRIPNEPEAPEVDSVEVSLTDELKCVVYTAQVEANYAVEDVRVSLDGIVIGINDYTVEYIDSNLVEITLINLTPGTYNVQIEVLVKGDWYQLPVRTVEIFDQYFVRLLNNGTNEITVEYFLPQDATIQLRTSFLGGVINSRTTEGHGTFTITPGDVNGANVVIIKPIMKSQEFGNWGKVLKPVKAMFR